MVEPQDNKPEQPVSASDKAVQKTTPPATSPAGEAAKNATEPTKTAKTDAAARIMERLQKTKAAPSQAKPERAAPPPRRKPGDAKEAPRPFQEITLTGDLAKLGEALRQKWLQPEAVLQTLMAQAQSEAKGKAVPVCDILQERKQLPAEKIKLLQAISELKLPLNSPLPKATQFDLLVGNQLMQKNLLPREEVQRILRLQANLHKLAMPINLETLLQTYQVLPPDALKSLIDELHKGVEEKKKQAGTITESAKAVKRRTALRSGESKPWPLLRWSALVVVVLAAGLLVLVKLTPPRSDVKPRPQIELPQAEPQPPVSKPTKPVRKERPISETDQEELIAKQMDARGLKPWGKHWLAKQHHEELSKRWEVGEKAQNFSLDLSAYHVGYATHSDSGTLMVQGKLSLPTLPTGLCLSMELHLLHGFQAGNTYAEARFALSEDHVFQVTIEGLPKPLEPGLYSLRLSLTPERQSEFLQDFFSLQQQPKLVWWLPFTIGNTAHVEKYIKTRLVAWEELYKEVWDSYQKLSQLVRKDGGKVRSEWETWSGPWQKNMLTISQKVQNEQARSLIPMLPTVATDMPQSMQQLQDLYQAWDNWQRDFTQKQLPEMSDRQAEFELRYDQFCLALKNEGEKLLLRLKESKASEAAEGN